MHNMSKVQKLQGNAALFWDYRELLFNLAKREIAARYKQSILGYGWVIINPLAQLLVLSFVFSTILRVNSLGVPFIIFLAVALLPWNFFSASLTHSANALVSNSSLITKIYFPREILVYATIIAKIVDFLFSVLILMFFLAFYHVPMTIMVLWIPLIFLIQLLLTTGISLMLAAFNLFYRDIQYLLTLVIMVWMYLTPIMYPIEIIPERFRFIMSLNPMAVIVNAYRQVIIGGGAPNTQSLAIGFFISVFIFIIGFMIFKKLEGQFADYV
jgi:ABC-type polysaccharide/polyol phosphate export permease